MREGEVKYLACCSHKRASNENAKALKPQLIKLKTSFWLHPPLMAVFFMLAFSSFPFLLCRGKDADWCIQTVCRPSPRSSSCCSAWASFSLWSEDYSTCKAAQPARTTVRVSLLIWHLTVHPSRNSQRFNLYKNFWGEFLFAHLPPLPFKLLYCYQRFVEFHFIHSLTWDELIFLLKYDSCVCSQVPFLSAIYFFCLFNFFRCPLDCFVLLFFLPVVLCSQPKRPGVVKMWIRSLPVASITCYKELSVCRNDFRQQETVSKGSF